MTLAWLFQLFLIYVCSLIQMGQGIGSIGDRGLMQPSPPNLKIVREWSALEFVFPSEEKKQEAIDKGYYNPAPSSNVPIDVDVHYSNGKRRIFITIPRFGKGRPISFGTLDDEGRVNAYPDYSWHDNQGSNCDGITSVFRTAIDKCNRLWVLDTGKIDKFYCTPQLLAFNLTNDELIYRHRFSNSTYNPSSLFVTPVVDARENDCSDTFVYVADVKRFTLLVVDVSKDQSWFINNRLFYPYPSAGTFIIEGQQFDLMDGLLGMALSPIKNGDRNLYFHALASVTENVVKTSVLRNNSFIGIPDARPMDFTILPGNRLNQSAAEAMDRNGILYFGRMNPPSIWCWNSNTEFSSWNLYPIAINRKTLQFSSGVKVITNDKGDEELWVITNSFQRFKTGTMNANETNFRIHSGSLSDILKTHPCNTKPKSYYSRLYWNTN